MKISRAEEKQLTITRILAASLQLYNESGVHSVSMHLIAEQAGISVGNLTYHFRKKTDINHALVDQLEQELLATFRATKDINPIMEEHADLLVRLVGALWRYRFFFNSLAFLIRNDVSQKKRYLKLKNMVVSVLSDAYEQLVSNGSMLPIDESRGGPEVFLENYWYLILSLCRLYMIESPKAQLTQKGYSRFAARHLFAFLSPYYSEAVKAGYRELLEREFG